MSQGRIGRARFQEGLMGLGPLTEKNEAESQERRWGLWEGRWALPPPPPAISSPTRGPKPSLGCKQILGVDAAGKRA